MAKPIDLYQGGAPGVFQQMGQGLAQAGANIGETWNKAYSSIGQSIGGALQSVGGMVGQGMQASKSAKASADMTKTILGDANLSNQIFGIPMDEAGTQQREKMMVDFTSAQKNFGNFGAQEYSKQILAPIFQQAAIGREFQNQINLQKAKFDLSQQYAPRLTTTPNINYEIPASDLYDSSGETQTMDTRDKGGVTYGVTSPINFFRK